MRLNGCEFHLGNKFVHENYRFKVKDLAAKVVVPTVYRCNYYTFHRFKDHRIQAYRTDRTALGTGINIGYNNNHCDFTEIAR